MHSRAISPGVSPRRRAAPPEGPAHQGLAAAWPSHGRRFASSGPPRPVGAARLDCLGPSRLTAKTSDLGYWISLDFLGFSRANPDLSMGYAGNSSKNFSWGFSPLGFEGGTEGGPRGDAEARERPWRNSKLSSDFPQSFVVRAVPSRSIPGSAPTRFVTPRSRKNAQRAHAREVAIMGDERRGVDSQGARSLNSVG